MAGIIQIIAYVASASVAILLTLLLVAFVAIILHIDREIMKK
jgi:hypothetical protein